MLALPTTRGRVLTATELSQQTVKGRTLLWGETLKLVRDNPLLGVGPSDWVDTIPAYHDPHYERVVGPADPPDSPHDWILQAAAAGGLGLALIGLILAVCVLRRGARAVAHSRRMASGPPSAGCWPASPATASRCCSTSPDPARRRWPRSSPGR